MHIPVAAAGRIPARKHRSLHETGDTKSSIRAPGIPCALLHNIKDISGRINTRGVALYNKEREVDVYKKGKMPCCSERILYCVWDAARAI
jgi:hypothetical protein